MSTIASADADKPIDGDIPTIAPAGRKLDTGTDAAERLVWRDTEIDGWVEGRARERYVASRVESREPRSGMLVANADSIKIAAGVAAVLLVGWLVWFLFIATAPQQLTIESHSWQRRIEVIDFQPRKEGGWSHPGDAYNIDRSWRIHHYDRVLSHYDSRQVSYSCGTYQAPRTCYRTESVPVYRDEPVYRWYYNFTIDRWRHARWITTGSETYSTPYWDDLTDENFDTSDVIGNEQLSGKRSENYKIFLSGDEGRRYERVVDLDIWEANKDGSVVTAHITRTNIVRSVDWIEPIPATVTL